jgi:hypothetical protein
MSAADGFQMIQLIILDLWGLSKFTQRGNLMNFIADRPMRYPDF